MLSATNSLHLAFLKHYVEGWQRKIWCIAQNVERLESSEGTEKIVTLAEGNSFSLSPQFMKMEILAFFSYQWLVCCEKAILRASKWTQKYNNQCIIHYLKMWKNGWNRKMTQNKRENPLFCVILIGYWGIAGYWKLMQNFENQFPQEVSIA